MTLQTRTCSIELRRDDSDGLVKGYVSTYETPEEHDTYGTIFGRGCWDDDIAERGPKGSNEIPSLWEHRDPFGMPVVLESDEKGLRMEVEPTATSENKDRLAYIDHGVVRGMSVGFDALEYKVHKDQLTPWGSPVIEFTRCKLREGSVTTRPSNHNALIDKARREGLEWKRTESGMWVPTVPGTSRDSRGDARELFVSFLDALDADKVVRAATLEHIARSTGVELERLAELTRAGKVLSTRNKNLLEGAVESIQQVLAAASTEDDTEKNEDRSGLEEGGLHKLEDTIGLFLSMGEVQCP